MNNLEKYRGLKSILKESFFNLFVLPYRFFDFIIPEISLLNILRGHIFKLFWESGSFFTIARGNWFQRPGNISIGKRVFINTENVFANGGKISIGDYSLIGVRNVFITGNHVEKGNQRGNELSYIKPIKIGNNVWITSNCTILPGTIIEDNVILSAGSVAKGELESGWIYCGNPAKKIRKTEGVLR